MISYSARFQMCPSGSLAPPLERCSAPCGRGWQGAAAGRAAIFSEIASENAERGEGLTWGISVPPSKLLMCWCLGIRVGIPAKDSGGLSFIHTAKVRRCERGRTAESQGTFDSDASGVPGMILCLNPAAWGYRGLQTSALDIPGDSQHNKK